MRIVALPSIYDRERAARPRPKAQRLWLALICGSAAALAVGIVVRPLLLPMVSLALAWPMCVGFYAYINSYQPVTQGELGERAALRSLMSLPDDYIAITNCKIPGHEQIGDLDIVVIGPPGVVVVEVKNFLRPLIVNGDYWASQGRSTPGPIKSVSRQLANEVKALASCLSRRHASAPVHGIIAVNANALINIIAPPPFPIRPYDALCEVIRALPPARPAVLPDYIERILCSTATPT